MPQTNDGEQLVDGELSEENAPVRPTNPSTGLVVRGNRTTGDLLQRLLEEAKHQPRLSSDEERELAIAYTEHGDRLAAEKLVRANLRTVIKIAFQYHGHWTQVLDLIQEGNVGLMEALRHFDPYRGVPFSAYARYWIRAMVLRFLLDNFRLVQFGRSRAGRKVFFQLRKEREQLLAEGVSPHPKLLAERLGVSEEEVRTISAHLASPPLSIDVPETEGGAPLRERIASDDEESNPEANTARRQFSEQLNEELSAFAETLTDLREQAIWSRRLVSIDPASLATLGREFGVTRERMRQLEVRIKGRLREFLGDRFGDELSIAVDTNA